MGRETLMKGMQARVEGQFKKSDEVKQKSIKNYPQLSKLFTALNNQEDPEGIKEALCNGDNICSLDFDYDFNLCKKGIDIGLKTIAQMIYNMFDDYLELKNILNNNVNLIRERFITKDFIQMDMTLNLLLYMVEERCAEVFLIEVDNLKHNFKTIIISLNISIIIFLAIISILMIFLIINKITRLLNLVEKSSLRISISINQLKEKYFCTKSKSGNLL